MPNADGKLTFEEDFGTLAGTKLAGFPLGPSTRPESGESGHVFKVDGRDLALKVIALPNNGTMRYDRLIPRGHAQPPPHEPDVEKMPGGAVFRDLLNQLAGSGVSREDMQRYHLWQRLLRWVAREVSVLQQLISCPGASDCIACPLDPRDLQYGCSELNGTRFAFFTSRWINGKPLSHLYPELHKYDAAKRRALFLGCVRPFRYLHHLRIVYRDIHPGNFMLDNSGHVVLLDLGLAKAQGDAHTTAREAPRGTTRYLPPGLTSGVFEPRNDLWALGMIGLEILSGSTSFDAEALRRCATVEAMRECVRAIVTATSAPGLTSHDLLILQRCFALPEEQHVRDADALYSLLDAVSIDWPDWERWKSKRGRGDNARGEYWQKYLTAKMTLEEWFQQEEEHEVAITGSLLSQPSAKQPEACEQPMTEAPKVELRLGLVIAQRYTLVEPICTHGGQGVVWKAVDSKLNRAVAVKSVRPDRPIDPQLLREEAHKLSQLQHPHLVSVLDLIEHDSELYIIMPLMSGGTLSERLASRPAIAPQEAARMIRKLAGALQQVHSAGWIHRDIKPQNILFDESGEPYLADLGIAATRNAIFDATRGIALGTWAYMSPEQVTGDVDRIDARTDIWSLGVVLYEMLTRKRLFVNACTVDPIETIKNQILKMDPQPPRQLNKLIPPALAEICLKCLEKDPKRRYETASDLGASLDALETSEYPIENQRANAQLERDSPERWATQSRDAFIAEYSPETCTTRARSADMLASTLLEGKTSLIVVASPPRWGKTAFLASVVGKCKPPMHVCFLANVRTPAQAIELLLGDVTGSYGEEDGESGAASAAWHIRRRFGEARNCWVLLADTHVNSSVDSGVLMEQVVQPLLHQGLGCIVELEDSHRFVARARVRLDRQAMIGKDALAPLSTEETAQWLSLYGLDSPGLVEAIAHLFEGDPGGIHFAIPQLKGDKDQGLSPNSDRVMELALEWSGWRGRPYVERVEAVTGRALSRRIIEWFALFWPVELPMSLPEKTEQQQLAHAARLGLVSATSSGFRAESRLHGDCIARLLRQGTEVGALSVAWGQLPEPLEESAYARCCRTMLEVAQQADARQLDHLRDSIQRLWQSRPTAPAETGKKVFIAPASPEAVTSVLPSLHEARDLIYALEEACRNAQVAESSGLWATILHPEREESVIRALNDDWMQLRSLSRAYWLTPDRPTFGREQRSSLLSLLQRLHPGGGGHLYYAARLALNLADDFITDGSLAESDESLWLADEAIRELPDAPPWDYRHERKLALRYFAECAHYRRSSSSLDGRVYLRAAADFALQALANEPDSYAWQARYVWVLSELLEFMDELPTEDEVLWIRCSHLAPSPVLMAFFIDWAECFARARVAESDGANQGVLAALGIALKGKGQSCREPASFDDFFDLICAMILGRLEAVSIVRRILTDAWLTRATGPDLFCDEVLRLTQLCLKLSTVPGIASAKQLGKVLAKIQPEDVDRWAGAATARTAGSVRLSYLNYRLHLLQKECLTKPAEVYEQKRAERTSGIQRLENQIAWMLNRYLALSDLGSSVVARVLAHKYEYTRFLWQHKLRTVRGGVARAVLDEPEGLRQVVEELEERCPYDSISMYHRARFSRYIWKHQEAYDAAWQAYRHALSSRRKRDALLLLADLLIDRVFTPAILRTSWTAPPADDNVVSRFREVVQELGAFWPNHEYLKFLRLFEEGLDRDAEYWLAVVSRAEQRLGDPERFWSVAAEHAVLPDAEDTVGEAFADLTAASTWEAISRAMRWASQREDFGEELRSRLATAAFGASYAAMRWNHSVGRFPLDVDYGVAVGIALAAQVSKDGRIFGRELSPMQSRSGRQHTWRKAAGARFGAIHQKAIGTFKLHVYELQARFQSLGIID